MKKGSSEPSPLARTRHIESVEVGFSGPSTVVEFSHSLFRPQKCAACMGRANLQTLLFRLTK